MNDAVAPGHPGAGRRAELMALLDDAMTRAAQQADATAREVATIDLHVAFLHPPQGQARATGRVCAGGKSVCFCEAEAVDADGRIVARAMGTLRYLAYLAPGDRVPPAALRAGPPEGE